MSIKITNFHGYNVQFSPNIQVLGLVGGSNYGLSFGHPGSGSLYVLSYDVHGTTLEIVCQYKSFEDVVLDLAWNPKSSITDANSSQHIVTSCGDGKVSVLEFDYLFNCLHPVKTIQAHGKEVASIEWCNDFILTSSWDLSTNVSVWDNNLNRIYTKNLSGMVYQSKSSPNRNSTVGCVTSSGLLNVWDLNSPPHNVIHSLPHGNDVLTLEWHKENQHYVLTGSSDGVIRLWDLRNHYQPVKRFFGHDHAVRNLVVSKFNDFLSCSYDMTVRSWDINDTLNHRSLRHHSEFVYGIDICPFNSNLAVDCSWDEIISLFHHCMNPY